MWKSLSPNIKQLILLTCCLFSIAAFAQDRIGDPEEILLETEINHQEQAGTILALRQQNDLLVRANDLNRWRIYIPHASPLIYNGADYYSLNSINGLSYNIDERRQLLIVLADPQVFTSTLLDVDGSKFIPSHSTSIPGGFINYDLFAQYAHADDRIDGLLELGLFNRFGVGVSNFLAENLDSKPRITRLETTWTRDSPEQLLSVRVGDAVTRGGAWGRPVLFGGAQMAVNFSTQPAFISYPRPIVSGEAAAPSTAELIVDNVKRLSRDVPPGPFTVIDLPVTNGQGELSLVVHDLLGREQLISEPYYVSTALLREGLQDYSLESGFIRENFGLESNNYGRFLTVGTYRAGLSDRLTGELRSEILRDQQTLGVSATYLQSTFGVFSPTLAISHNDEGAGGLLQFGVERESRHFSFGLLSQHASANFTQTGLQPGQTAPQRTTQARLGFGLGRWGSLGINYFDQNNRDEPGIRLFTASYNTSLGTFGALSISAFHTLGDNSDTTLGVTVTIPLGKQVSASANVTGGNHTQQALVQVQRNLPAGEGFAYRILAGTDNAQKRLEAGLTLNNRVGTYLFEGANNGGETSFRLGASGGLAILDGSGFLTRRVSDSFGVVKVPNYPNVRIYADNQVVARTDATGNALLPHLRAYERNKISIEQADLPLNTEIGALEQEAVPYFRSGQLVKFSVKHSAGAIVKIVLGDGTPLPAGASVRAHGEDFPVAFNGEVYITGLERSNKLHAFWHGQSCTLEANILDMTDPLPYLGPLTCGTINP